MPKSILSALILICIFVCPLISAEKKIIYPSGIKPGGNWSPGILVDGTLYVSGMAGENAAGKIPGTFEPVNSVLT